MDRVTNKSSVYQRYIPETRNTIMLWLTFTPRRPYYEYTRKNICRVLVKNRKNILDRTRTGNIFLRREAAYPLAYEDL